MKKLPIELQTLIVKELPTRDICRLQQTCKAFYDLIEGNSEVWKERLRRQCSTDVLWSSFSGFTASELRRACTGTLRFKHRYRRGGNPKPPIPRLLPYNSEHDNHLYRQWQEIEESDNPYPEISATFLVPGGRFLITVDMKWLRVWDLGSPGSLNEPCEVVRYERLHCVDMIPEIADAIVVGKDTVHLLIQEFYSQDTLPQSFGINRSEYSLNRGSMFAFFHRFQIRLPDRGQPSVKFLDRLCVLHSGSDISVAQHGPIVAFGMGPRVLLWGTSDSPDKSWVASASRTCEHAVCQKVFFHQGYAFFADSASLNGFDLTGITHRPVGKGLVDLQRGSPDIGSIPPPRTWTHQQDFHDNFRARATDFMLHKPVAEAGPLFYEIRHPQLQATQQQPGSDPSEGTYLQFCFSFHPDDPTASSLGPTKRYRTTSQPCDTPYFYFALDEGVRGYIWYGRYNFNRRGKGANIRIFVSIVDDPDSPEPSASDIEGLGYFSEMIEWTNSKPPGVLSISVCPLSGRVVVLWGQEFGGEHLVETFDLYDSSRVTT
ncbi:hypothetical protein DFP72DRAFT_1114388 [Ephemerocybe angulata]|uniref:F-box domain-containing protein n=1 Tax=Ephemerocybe angulata TaxID=980116 RepID=A0A8H6I170_9AGAR|nr:hypothetical protein DFP72DRAFT_1114388 [Tulosesus angulatus]